MLIEAIISCRGFPLMRTDLTMDARSQTDPSFQRINMVSSFRCVVSKCHTRLALQHYALFISGPGDCSPRTAIQPLLLDSLPLPFFGICPCRKLIVRKIKDGLKLS